MLMKGRIDYNKYIAQVPYPTIHRFVAEMCACVHISATNGASWDICLMHSGIYEMGLS